MSDLWECFLCGKEEEFCIPPTGYLSNSHALCNKCANVVLYNLNHKQRSRLTFHNQIGDLQIIANIPVEKGYPKMN